MPLLQRKTPRLKGYDSILTNPARWAMDKFSLTARSMASFNSMESRYLLIFATKTAYSYKTWQLSMNH